MTETFFIITTSATMMILVVAEMARLARRRDVDFFFGAVLAVADPLFMTFVIGRPFHQSSVSIAFGAFYFWRWWRHRNDDDDDHRGQRWRAWAKSKLPRVDGRPVRVPVVDGGAGRV